MPVLVYSVLRILLIFGAGAGLYLAGMRGWLLVVVAVLVGAGLSYVLLDKQRRASAEWLAARGRRHTRLEDRLASDADAEDALLDHDQEDVLLDDEAVVAGPGETAGSTQTGEASVDEDREQGSDGEDDQQPQFDAQL